MAIHFWRTRDRFRGGRWFVVALTMAMLAAVCFLGQLLAAGRAGAVFWSQATGIAGLGALFGIFGFAVTYTHREWVLRSRWFAGLAGALVAVFLLRLTNDLPGWPGVHQLWAVDARTTTRGGYRLVDVTAGPLWAAYTAVVVVMLLVLIALVVVAKTAASVYRYYVEHVGTSVFGLSERLFDAGSDSEPPPEMNILMLPPSASRTCE